MKVGPTRAVIALQALVIAVLAAALWYGRVGPPSAASTPTPARPVAQDQNGRAAAGGAVAAGDAGARGDDDENAAPGVHLKADVQESSGVRSAALVVAHAPRGGEAWGEVLAAQGLADARLRLRQAALEVSQWDEPLVRAQREGERLDALWQDGGNVARKLVDQAHAELRQTQQRQAAAHSLLEAQRGSIRAEWGTAILDALEQADGGALAGVFSGHERLLLLSDGSQPRGSVAVSGDAAPPIAVHRFGPASQVASGGNRATWYWLGAADRLRAGQRVHMAVGTGSGAAGVLVPESAVVWQAGQSWVYLKDDDEQFRRVAVTLGPALDGGWYAGLPLRAGALVVVQGAQLLLSEESRPQIRNENGD